MTKEKTMKKTWVTPELVVHGNVEKITQDIIFKTPGASDIIVIGQDQIDAPGSKLIR